VVIDPKGEVYSAVADRRRALGRRVICLDPMNRYGGADRWNPLLGRKASDVLYLQGTALALLPEPTGNDEASAYFRIKAVDLIAGAMQVVLNGENPSIVKVQRLMTDDETFVRELQKLVQNGKSVAASTALSILQYDAKSRDQIKATASQAFQWLANDCMQRLVGQSTFELSSLSSGSVDLFVIVPTEDTKILAPFLRWFLADLFNGVRRNRPKERIVVFLDEAAAIGRFEAILTAAGELPGYGLSLWTFWQSRSQIVTLYGEEGAATIVNTAEIVTVSNVSPVDPDESERWSRALGNYTARVETSSHATEGKANATKSYAPQAVPLMTKEALVTMPSNELLAFPNGEKSARHPLRLRKTVAHTDARFKKIIHNVPPADATG
jgi:type IV secretion system protein VirD4